MKRYGFYWCIKTDKRDGWLYFGPDLIFYNDYE